MWDESKDQRAAWRDLKGESLCGRHQCGLGKRVTEREDRGRVVSLAPAPNSDHKAPPSRESYPDLVTHTQTAISEHKLFIFSVAAKMRGHSSTQRYI